MQHLSRVVTFNAVVIFLALLFCAAPTLADGPKSKKPVAQSADKRFADFGDGTILDTRNGLMWMKQDYWQREGKWISWYTAVEYAQRMNHKNFAGYSDWRLPTPDEAETLYERRKRNVDKGGTWTRMAIKYIWTGCFLPGPVGAPGQKKKKKARRLSFP